MKSDLEAQIIVLKNEMDENELLQENIKLKNYLEEKDKQLQKKRREA